MFKLRPYQRQCVDAFYNYYKANDGHGLIVVPTAGGKSLIIGTLATEICQRWPGQRILVLSHVKELIQQNHGKIMQCWPSAPAGIYNASLGKRQAHHPIVVGTVQSVYKKADALGHRDLLFIDEAHLLQPGNMGMYSTLIKSLLKINPMLKICGFTATDYRTDSGLLTEGEGALFTDIIIEVPIKDLIYDGYLTPPISKASLVQADLQGVKITAGEYNIRQMAERFDQKAFMNAALDSDLPFFEGRNSIALFCATIENAEHVAQGMCARGIYTEVVDGEMGAIERDDKIAGFRSGELRGLASVGVITTGTDIPNIDCIVLFRATKSPGLYQQIIGRGFRVMYAPGHDIETREGRIEAIRSGVKPNFLTLDHGANIQRHGAIVSVEKPSKANKEKRGYVIKALVRICEKCRTAWPLETKTCNLCGNVMTQERDATAGLDIEASNEDIMGSPFGRGEAAQWFDVDDVRYARHKKDGRPDSLRVTYHCGILQFCEWIHFEFLHKGFLEEKSVKWWRARSSKPLPAIVTEALSWIETLKKPRRILVLKKDTLFNILNCDFNQQEDAA